MVRQWFRQIGREYYLRFGPYLSFMAFAICAVGLIESHDRRRWIGPAVGLSRFAAYCFSATPVIARTSLALLVAQSALMVY